VSAQDRETRFMWRADCEVRSEGEGAEARQVIAGHAVLFGSRYQTGFDVVESVRAGAFTRTLGQDRDILAMFNHNPSQVLGSRASGTAEFLEDERGLSYRVVPPNTSAGRDVTELVAAGIIRGSSMTFGAVEQEFTAIDDGQVLHRELIEVALHEAGPVTSPANTATTSELATRSLSDLAAQSGFDVDEILAAIEARSVGDIVAPRPNRARRIFI